MPTPAPPLPAFALYQNFAPAPASPFRTDRHYLLYAATGTMRLEAEGRCWTLPPARAALIAAGHEISVALLTRLTACSVLFLPDFVAPPPATLAVFDMSPLARELVLECGRWGAECKALPDRAVALFAALAHVAWELAEHPSPASMPLGRSLPVQKALARTEAQLCDNPSFEAIAAEIALSPRTLARRIQAEIGMSWGDAMRRLRMLRAIERLATSNDPVTEIALSVGYGSLSAFNAAFRAFTGMTPRDYRRSFEPQLSRRTGEFTTRG